MKWNNPDIKPKNLPLYDKNYMVVLADDRDGFIKEAFYEPQTDSYSALGMFRGQLHFMPLVITRWAYLPESENK